MVDHTAELRRELTRLRDIGRLTRRTASTTDRSESLAYEMGAAAKAALEGFAMPGGASPWPDLEKHVHEHVREIVRLLDGGDVQAFEFVRDHARRRAEQHFPLEATLHTYRCGHRAVLHWLCHHVRARSPRDATHLVAAAADFSLEYTNAISIICTAAYVAHARLLAEQDREHRNELLKALLDGHDEADERIRRLLKRQGFLDQRQSFRVVLARSVDPREMEFPGRAQRIVEALSDALAPLQLRVLLGVRRHEVAAVLSGTVRTSGWTLPQPGLSERLAAPLGSLGPSVLIGTSRDHPSIDALPRALQEATIALDMASVSERVVAFGHLTLRRLLVHMGREAFRFALPARWAEFQAVNRKSHGVLIDTLRAYADADLNVLEAARVLKVHPNTVYARVQRVADITGLDGRRFHDLMELLLFADGA